MNDQPTERVDAVVRGVVQGVGFRWFVVRRARELGLTGWVANRPDGGVVVVAEGPGRALDDLLALLRSGPPGASVSDVEVARGGGSGSFSNFQIRAVAHRGD